MDELLYFCVAIGLAWVLMAGLLVHQFFAKDKYAIDIRITEGRGGET